MFLPRRPRTPGAPLRPRVRVFLNPQFPRCAQRASQYILARCCQTNVRMSHSPPAAGNGPACETFSAPPRLRAILRKAARGRRAGSNIPERILVAATVARGFGVPVYLYFEPPRA